MNEFFEAFRRDIIYGMDGFPGLIGLGIREMDAHKLIDRLQEEAMQEIKKDPEPKKPSADRINALMLALSEMEPEALKNTLDTIEGVINAMTD